MTERVYLATWLQRTSLHLREIRHFLQGRFSALDLDKDQLQNLKVKIGHSDVLLVERNGFDYLKFNCNATEVSISEDGIIMLAAAPGDFTQAKTKLTKFYNQTLGPALSYLFSRGAPLPRRLSDAEEMYPMLFVTATVAPTAMEAFLTSVGSPLLYKKLGGKIDWYHSEQVVVLRLHDKFAGQVDQIDELLRNVVFIREFEQQLSRYLNLHRSMWESVSAIRESKDLRYRDFARIRKEIMDFLSTLSFVKSRLAQMEDILEARSAALDEKIADLLSEVGLFRFTKLKSDARYISHLWEMTIEYVQGTSELLEFLYQENTQKELSALKFITFIGVLASFFGMNIAFPWEDRWSQIALTSYYVVFLMVILVVAFYFYLRFLIHNRRFEIQ